MQKSEIRGIIVPILTPMHKDEKLNLEELRRQVDRMIGAGIHGIFCLGTNGEAFALSDEEIEMLMQPETFTGMAAHQCDKFLKEIVAPVLEQSKDEPSVTADINV